MIRRTIFRIHMWTGVIAALYVCVVSITGTALLFRINLQRALDPHLFDVHQPGPIADPATIMERVTAAYPDLRLAGVEAPTTTRPTYLAYVTGPDSFRTVMLDPVTTEILGELPDRQLIVFLRGLHGRLLAGNRGRVVNGIGACALATLSVTGVVVWWQRRSTAGRRAFVTTHRTTGIVAAAFILMWAVTGYSLLFPAHVRAAVHWISPVTVARPPQSITPSDAVTRPSWRAVVAEARRHGSGPVARVVLPANERGAFLVLFADSAPTAPGPGHLTSVYLDQYSLQRLPDSAGHRSTGDVVMAWLTPLHVAGFGGWGVKLIWLLMGLAGPTLAVTGLTLWLRRRQAASGL